MSNHVIAYAITDTDGGRHEPRVLVRHIYSFEAYAVAIRNRRYSGREEYYPIRKITITLEEPDT